MQHKSFALSFLTALAGLASAEDKASDVVQLTGSTFKDFVTTNPIVLAEFFAPWCGHCKALAPEYEEAATTLKGKDIRLAKIDCTEEADLCQEHGVQGYPTLYVFRGPDNKTAYSGQRKADGITSYMIKQSLPAVSNLDKDTLEEFKTADKVVLVAYYSADDKASAEAFTGVADSLRDNYLFGAVTDVNVATAENVKFPSIVLYKTFDEGKNVFSENFDAEAITTFAKTSATPLIGAVGPETYADYMSAGIPLAYIFAETEEERDAFAKELRPIAEQYKGKINVATIDAKAFGAHAGNLNLPTDQFPSFAIQDIEKNLKFPFDIKSKITHDAIAKFMKDFSDGKVEPSIKSEEIPKVQEGPVTVVVAKNYEDIVLDDTKDVLLEFYAPWCGHCKALAPKYEDLASQYASSEFKDKIVIAKVDATANDVPDDIAGFPTIKLFPAGSKKDPITYSGSRSIEDLAKFIEENGKHKAGVSIREAATDEAASAATGKAEKADEKHDEL